MTNTTNNALAERISSKKGEKYDDVMRYIRAKTSFLTIKATLLCIRGSRPSKIKNDIGVATTFHNSINSIGVSGIFQNFIGVATTFHNSIDSIGVSRILQNFIGVPMTFHNSIVSIGV